MTNGGEDGTELIVTTDLPGVATTIPFTSGPDVVDITRSGSQVLATGLAAQTRIVGNEAVNDTLWIQTLGGDDDVTVGPDVSELISPVVDLGADE